MQLGEVIDYILNIVPKNIDEYDMFHRGLHRIVISIAYTAPEAIHVRWVELCRLCTFYFLPKYTGTPWEVKIRSLFASL